MDFTSQQDRERASAGEPETESERDSERPDGYDEDDAFLCACKGEPYTTAQWEAHVERLRAELADAQERCERAQADGVCLPERFDTS